MKEKIIASGDHLCRSDEDVIRKLDNIDPGYSILYCMGSGTGADLIQLLMLDVSDVGEKDYITMPVGPLQIRRTFNFPRDLREELREYIGDRNGPLFVRRDGSPITPASAEKILKQCHVNKPFLHILLRRYYEETEDIYYPQHMLQIDTEEAALHDLY